jgi:pilus assembly protein Flp/PilA
LGDGSYYTNVGGDLGMNLIEKTTGFAKKLWKDEAGQGMVEYGLILALVAVGIIATLTLMEGQLDGIFQYITGELDTANPSS